MNKRWPLLVGVAIPFVLYLLTLFPGIGDRSGTGDAIEFQYVGRILGVAHEPGYPQFVLLSYLWTALPLPLALAVKVNLLSAVVAGLSGWFLFSALRLLEVRPWTATWLVILVLLAPDIWLLATQAEVYSLNLFWVTGVLWAAIRWDASGRPRDLIWLFLLYAVSFGNHLTMILLFPGLVVLVLWRQPRVVLQWQLWLWAILAIGVGLLQYGLLWWRSYHPHPALPPWFPLEADLSQLWAYVSGDRFVQRHWLKGGWIAWGDRLVTTLRHGAVQLSFVLALLAAAGTWIGLRSRPRITVCLGIIAASVICFAASYGIKDALYYAIPAWVCLGLLGGIGLERIVAHRPRWRLPVGVGLIAIVLLRALIGYNDLHSTRQVTADLTAAIATAPPGSGILVGRRDRQARLADGYYRYGVALDRAASLSFHSTSRVFASGVEDIADLPLYFQSMEVRHELDDRWVDYRRTGTTSPAVFVTGTEAPIETLELRALWNRTLALAIRQRSADLLGTGHLHLVLIDGLTRRSKGHTSFAIGGAGQWQRELRRTLSAADRGDWFLIVLPATEAGTHSRVARILDDNGVHLEDRPFADHTIVFWRVGRPEFRPIVVPDLEGRLELPLTDDAGSLDRPPD